MTTKRPTKKAPVKAGAVASVKDAAKAYEWFLERRKEKFEKGDAESVLWAVHYVIEGKITFPPWLATAVDKAIMGYMTHEYASLDAAFGVGRPKGYRRKSIHEQASRAHNSNWIIIELHKHGYAIDDQLFEVVGERFNVKKTTAKKWYYEAKNSNDPVFQAFERSDVSSQIPEHLKAIADQLKADK
ncbi:hypothetical protein [Luteimonas aquatica]|uniref:hypothetical protein n=1 Tax=Luteimonas aquatica TaxID=450364 RepID=UPI001F5969FF|nr:hypothetical protein [Luteimonas aquatica]